MATSERYLNKSLCIAAEQGDVESARKCISDGANINYKNRDGWTLLYIASFYGHADVVRILLENKADPNISDEDGTTPLSVAKNSDICELLIAHGATVEADYNNKSLYNAAKHGDVEWARKCISDGANVNDQHEKGWTPLSVASSNGHTDVVRILLENKADPNITNKNGRTPLSVADNADICELLIVHGATVEADYINMWLFKAAAHGDVEWARKCISDGANVNDQHVYGRTPLWITSHNVLNTALMRILLENKADPNISDEDGDTPLSVANNSDICELLIAHGATVEDDYINKWLFRAAEHGDVEWARKCISDGANVNYHTGDGWTPLYTASHYECNDIRLVRILLENKADPNISDEDGRTPLDVADNVDIIELLTAHGATHGINQDATIEVYIEEISKVVRGAKGKMKVTCFLLHGAPFAGKTSAKRLLLGLPPLDRGNSTKLLEDVVKAIRNIGTIKVTAVNESCLELEVMDGKKTIQMIQREIQKFLENKASQKKSKSNKESSPASPRHTTNDTVHDHRPATPTPGPSHSSPDEGKSSLPLITESPNPSRSEVLCDIATDLDSLESSTDGSTLFQCHHINIVDSGGQSQFSNLLPLVFLSQLHHHLVTIRLDQLLSDKPKNCYSRDGTIHQLPERLVLTNYQLIERVCQLAAGSQSRVIIIATRLDDQNTEEPLAKKNELLKPLVQKYTDNIVLNEKDEPIFAVNAMAPVGEERKEYTKMLQKVILDAPVLTTNNEEEEDGIDVPLRWIVLEQELNYRQSEDVGVFEMNKTKSIAKDLHVHKEELSEALDFFKELALLYHYPVLPDKVFTSITPISLRLSEIVEATLVHKGGVHRNKHLRLQNTGKLSKSFLKKLCRKLPSNEFFSLDDFVSLMIHLRVFFPIDPDTIFIPSLLPVEITEPLGKDLHEPLLCYWMHDDDEVRILPQSYFHALIVELLGRKETIKLNTMRNHSRSTIHLIAILTSHKEYRLVVVDCDFWFEVFVDNSLECKQRQLLLELIQSCTARVLDQLKLSRLGELQYGLRCYSPECSVEGGHPSKCVDHCPFRFKCLKSGEFWREEESGRYVWFRDQQSSDVDDTLLTVSSDLIAVLSAIISVVKWQTLGLELPSLEKYQLDRIEIDNHGIVEDCQKAMVIQWLHTGVATWRGLIQALTSPLVNRRDLAIEIAKQHQKKITNTGLEEASIEHTSTTVTDVQSLTGTLPSSSRKRTLEDTTAEEHPPPLKKKETSAKSVD